MVDSEICADIESYIITSQCQTILELYRCAAVVLLNKGFLPQYPILPNPGEPTEVLGLEVLSRDTQCFIGRIKILVIGSHIVIHFRLDGGVLLSWSTDLANSIRFDVPVSYQSFRDPLQDFADIDAAIVETSLLHVRSLEGDINLPMFDKLPTLVLYQIFSHLSGRDLHEICFVSRRFQSIAYSDDLWRKVCEGHSWFTRIRNVADRAGTWRTFYRRYQNHRARRRPGRESSRIQPIMIINRRRNRQGEADDVRPIMVLDRRRARRHNHILYNPPAAHPAHPARHVRVREVRRPDPPAANNRLERARAPPAPADRPPRRDPFRDFRPGVYNPITGVYDPPPHTNRRRSNNRHPAPGIQHTDEFVPFFPIDLDNIDLMMVRLAALADRYGDFIGKIFGQPSTINKPKCTNIRGGLRILALEIALKIRSGYELSAHQNQLPVIDDNGASGSEAVRQPAQNAAQAVASVVGELENVGGTPLINDVVVTPSGVTVCVTVTVVQNGDTTAENGATMAENGATAVENGGTATENCATAATNGATSTENSATAQNGHGKQAARPNPEPTRDTVTPPQPPNNTQNNQRKNSYIIPEETVMRSRIEMLAKKFVSLLRTRLRSKPLAISPSISVQCIRERVLADAHFSYLSQYTSELPDQSGLFLELVRGMLIAEPLNVQVGTRTTEDPNDCALDRAQCPYSLLDSILLGAIDRSDVMLSQCNARALDAQRDQNDTKPDHVIDFKVVLDEVPLLSGARKNIQNDGEVAGPSNRSRSEAPGLVNNGDVDVTGPSSSGEPSTSSSINEDVSGPSNPASLKRSLESEGGGPSQKMKSARTQTDCENEEGS